MEARAAQHLDRAASVKSVEFAGIKKLNMYHMVNTKLKLEIQILLMKYRHLMSKEIEEAFDNLHDEIPSDE
jgi:hypothetical protein